MEAKENNKVKIFDTKPQHRKTASKVGHDLGMTKAEVHKRRARSDAIDEEVKADLAVMNTEDVENGALAAVPKKTPPGSVETEPGAILDNAMAWQQCWLSHRPKGDCWVVMR